MTRSVHLERFLLVAFVDAEERSILLQEAAGDPRAEEYIRASTQIADLLGEGRELLAEPGSVEALAFLAASRLSEPGRQEGAVAELARRVAANPAASDKLDELERQIKALNRESDAEEHFRRLTGLAPEPGSGARRGWGLRSPLVAAVLAIATLGLFALLGRWVEDPQARAAYRSVLEDRQALTRGPRAPGDLWLDRLEPARQMVLGVWPRYDHELLRSVEHDLLQEDTTSARAWALIALVRTMAGDHEGAEAAREAAERHAPTPPGDGS